MRPQITLVLPPLTQLNTPYPSVAYLARTLRRAQISFALRDLSLEFALRLFSRQGISAVFDAVAVKAEQGELPDPAWRALALRARHEAAIGPVVRFLQGREPGMAHRILGGRFLPAGPRGLRADMSGFGDASVEDAARHLATLYLEDLADLVTACLDPGFGLASYQHHLGVSPAPYDALQARLDQQGLLDGWIDGLADTLCDPGDPADSPVIGLSVPFPGTLYAALRIGRRLRAQGRYVVMGGGFVSTELREVSEDRLWDAVDALCYDDGEGPLLALLDWHRNRDRPGFTDQRHRTRTRDGLLSRPAPDHPAESAAWYADLDLSPYLQLIDGTNPAHRLWSDGRWSRITLAHGCYWKKCSFCDIQLDYISRYAPSRASVLVDQMEELIAATGQSGFHLSDEAAPPRGMRDLALEILRRGLVVHWWGNIRFDETFTPDLCRLLAAAGLIAVTGGLEVASDRLLEKMQKGVTVAQVARVARNFRQAGVRVHAYLMYGFPTQTDQETVDALETVRQLFSSGALSSAFWHRFVLTRHSGIYPDPARFGIEVIEDPRAFARNDLDHRDPQGGNHDRFDDLLPRALHAWMRGQQLDAPLTTWGRWLPATTVPPDLIRLALQTQAPATGSRLIWTGGEVLESGDGLRLNLPGGEEILKLPAEVREVVGGILMAARPEEPALKQEEVQLPEWLWGRLRRSGLLVV